MDFSVRYTCKSRFGVKKNFFYNIQMNVFDIIRFDTVLRDIKLEVYIVF